MCACVCVRVRGYVCVCACAWGHVVSAYAHHQCYLLSKLRNEIVIQYYTADIGLAGESIQK